MKHRAKAVKEHSTVEPSPTPTPRLPLLILFLTNALSAFSETWPSARIPFYMII